jgi:hypothetical protein
MSNNPAYTCTSLRVRQHESIKVVCRVTATPDGQSKVAPKVGLRGVSKVSLTERSCEASQ